MKPSKQVRRNLTKTAQSSQRQTEAIGRFRRIDPATLQMFLHKGNLATARPGAKLRLPVFELTTDNRAPEYECGDLLQLDTEAKPRHGNIVVAQRRDSGAWVFGRLSIKRNGALLINLPRLGAVDPALPDRHVRGFLWLPPSTFSRIYVVVGLLRREL